VISVMDPYKKTDKRLKALAQEGMQVVPYSGEPSARFETLMRDMADLAREFKMEVSSCAEEIDMAPFGIRSGKCIDDAYIAQVFGITVSGAKDRSQRKACGCVTSRDIGIYDSCLFGCRYCYATGSFDRARKNWRAHDPHSPSMLGHHDANPPKAQQSGQAQLPLLS
jgi:sulfatase maturation enzyme AslB (radical SAM superfamily)